MNDIRNSFAEPAAPALVERLTPADIDARFDTLRAAFDRHGQTVAAILRDAVTEFNAAPISISSVDHFRDRVLRIADMVAHPLPDVALENAETLLAETVGLRRVK